MNNYYVKIKNNLLKEDLEYIEFQNKVNSRILTSSYQWINKWYEIFKDENNKKYGCNKKILLTYLYKNEELIAIAPFLYLERKVGFVKIRFIEFIAQQWAATYCDIISNGINDYERKFLFSEIKKTIKIDFFLLNHIPSFTRNFLQEDLLPYEVCPEINIEKYKNYDDYKNQVYSKNHKQNLRTAHNRAKKNNQVIHTVHKSQNNAIFDTIKTLAKSKLKDNKEYKYEDEKKSRFRFEIMDVFKSNISLVYLDKREVAYRTNLIYGNTKYCMDASFDREYPKYNLGIISVDSSVKDSIDKKLEYHCEGPGIDFYKKRFATEYVKLNYYLERGNTFLSLLLFNVLKEVMKRKSKQFLNKNQNE